MSWGDVLAQTPALATLGAAYLLYRSNEKSSKREATDRQAERDALQATQANELEVKKIEAKQAESEAERREKAESTEARRLRMVRFLKRAQEVALHVQSQQGYAAVTPPSMELLRELAEAYADVLLDAPQPLDEKIKQVKWSLDGLIEGQTTNVDHVEDALNELRSAYRSQYPG